MWDDIPPGWEIKQATVVTAGTTWTKSAALARGSVLLLTDPVGPGGQGGGGLSATFGQGGSGAGAGARNPHTYFISDLPSSVTITIGAAASSAGTEGNNGANGTATSFGTLNYAFGGGGGGTPSADAGAGGGIMSAGEGGFDAVAMGGQPSWGRSHTTATTGLGYGGSSGGDETDNDGSGAENFRSGVFGGPGGGCGSSGVVFKGGGGHATAGAGGAGGNSASALDGADGGFSGTRSDGAKAGHGGAGATGTAGTAGTAGTTDPYTGLGTGGGGGGRSAAGNGGNGGDGGVPGGGGGGAGAGATSGAKVSGTGGTGARGEMLLVEFGPPSSSLGTQLDEQRPSRSLNFGRVLPPGLRAAGIEYLPPLAGAPPPLGTYVDFDGPRIRTRVPQPRPSAALAGDLAQRPLAQPVEFDRPRTPPAKAPARTPIAEPLHPLLALLTLPGFDGPRTPRIPTTPLPQGRLEPIPQPLALLPFLPIDGPRVPRFVMVTLPLGRPEPIPPLLPLLPSLSEAFAFPRQAQRVPTPTTDVLAPIQAQAPTPPALLDDRILQRSPGAHVQRPDEGLPRLLGPLPALIEDRSRTPPGKAPPLPVAPWVPPALVVQGPLVALPDERAPRPRAPQQPLLQDAGVLPAQVPPAPPPMPQDTALLVRAPSRGPRLPVEETQRPPTFVGVSDERAFARSAGARPRVPAEFGLPVLQVLYPTLDEPARFRVPARALASQRFETVLPPIPRAVLFPWLDPETRRPWFRHRFWVTAFAEGALTVVRSYVAAPRERAATLQARRRSAVLLSRPRKASLH